MPLKLIVTQILLVGLVYGLLSGFPVLAQDQPLDLTKATPVVLDESHFADLDAYINDAMLDYGGSGLAVAIVQNNEIVYLKGFGVTELGGTVPVRGDTQFMIASLGKSMTALMIGTLIEDGILSWDTPVIDILPSFALSDPEATRSVTFRDLLSMRSGLPVFDAPIALTTQSPEQIIESLALIPLEGKTGEAFRYSNLGYASAGFVAALAAGAEYGRNVYETFAQLMQDRLFDPVGMDRTTFDFSGPIQTQNRAAPIGIDITTGQYDMIPFEFERGGLSITPAGGTTWSTAEDLAKYLMMQMNGGVTSDGTRVISEALLEETWMPHISQPNGTSYSLGWDVSEYQGLRALNYTGGMRGYTPRIQFLPEANLGVVVLTNRGLTLLGSAVGDYVYELAFGLDHTADAYYGAVVDQIDEALAQVTSMLQTETDGKMLASYVGQYGQDISVYQTEEGELMLATTNGALPLDAVKGQTGFFIIRNIGLLAAQFAENDEGAMTITFVTVLGDPQPPFVVTRIE